MRAPRTTAARALTLCGSALVLQGCGLFGVAGPGLGPIGPQVDPKCADIPNQLARTCPLAGIGATEAAFNNAHPYVGSKVVIPGQTNYVDLRATNGLVTGFTEQFQAHPPYRAGEARQATHGEMPPDARKIFEKTIGTSCAVVLYKSHALLKLFGPSGDAVLVKLLSPGVDAYDPKNVTSATITVTAPVTRATATC